MLVVLTVWGAGAHMRRAAPIRVRMVAYIGEKLAGIRPEFTWTVMSKGKKYELYVLKLDVLMAGGPTPLGIDSAVAPYAVKFQVVGEKTALEKFRSIPPRQQVVLLGVLRLDGGGRYLMLDSVDTGEPATPTP
ncbi:MAG TPA: hypothetical protein VL049_11225 [Candidatus Dormibacteraeota bacterium]|nr:hypothetical protein [Candidatus Dormibacteraeota bacterium]